MTPDHASLSCLTSRTPGFVRKMICCAVLKTVLKLRGDYEVLNQGCDNYAACCMQGLSRPDGTIGSPAHAKIELGHEAAKISPVVVSVFGSWLCCITTYTTFHNRSNLLLMCMLFTLVFSVGNRKGRRLWRWTISSIQVPSVRKQSVSGAFETDDVPGFHRLRHNQQLSLPSRSATLSL